MLNGQMDGLLKTEPSPSRNSQGDISHQLQFSGAVLSQIAGYGRVRSEKSPLALKGPCIICKAKLPMPGFLALAPPYFLIIPGPLPGAFDFVFHLSGLC